MMLWCSAPRSNPAHLVKKRNCLVKKEILLICLFLSLLSKSPDCTASFFVALCFHQNTVYLNQPHAGLILCRLKALNFPLAGRKRLLTDCSGCCWQVLEEAAEKERERSTELRQEETLWLFRTAEQAAWLLGESFALHWGDGTKPVGRKECRHRG